jgi:competence protein ComEA
MARRFPAGDRGVVDSANENPLLNHMTPKALFSFLPLLAAIPMIVSVTAGEALTPFKSCKLMPTEWADGDSFPIQTKDGTSHTIRLYGADCIEWHVADETDARRLRAQRRYFGISEFGGSPQASIDAAKVLGKAAAEEVVAVLAKPFTVHTAFADARGDGKHKRIYGFVTTANGEDLAERLIRLGLARAFGVYRETPTAKSAKDYQEYLRDVELQAAKRGVGVWAKTNWDRLPDERQAERQEDADLDLATASSKLPPGTRINPNTAARDELMRLPGIGEVTANRIIEARPFKGIKDLRNVEGIGEKTLARITPFLQIP